MTTSTSVADWFTNPENQEFLDDSEKLEKLERKNKRR
jgi:hypothetical protein